MKWFKMRKAQDITKQFTGKKITVYPTAKDATERTNGVHKIVEHIAGNLTHQTMFQVNGTHLVSMLDAYCELFKEPMPAKKMHEDFLSTVVTHIETAKSEKSEPKPTEVQVESEVTQ